MWKKLSTKEQVDFLNKWIRELTKDETRLSLRRHVVRHAKEIYGKDPKEWIASMRNLTDAYEVLCKVKQPSTLLRIQKLYNKYKKNPRRYTAPPKY
jgi:hypothetical protein